MFLSRLLGTLKNTFRIGNKELVDTSDTWNDPVLDVKDATTGNYSGLRAKEILLPTAGGDNIYLYGSDSSGHRLNAYSESADRSWKVAEVEIAPSSSPPDATRDYYQMGTVYANFGGEIHICAGNAPGAAKWYRQVTHIESAVDPTGNDKLPVGSTWTNTATENAWISHGDGIWRLLSGQPFVEVRTTVQNTFAPATYFVVPWNDVVNNADTYGMWDSATPERIYSRVSGWYYVHLVHRWVAGTNGKQRRTRQMVNGAGIKNPHTIPYHVSWGAHTSSGFVFLWEGQYITAEVYHDESSDATLNSNTSLMMIRLDSAY
jgi:hypothetical protein